MKQFLHRFGPIAGIIVLTLLFAQVLIYDVSSISYFSPTEKSSDFKMTDFYDLVANSSAVHRLDPDIVIVSVDNLSRSEIADVMDILALGDQACVGVDLLFNHPQECDSHLIESLQEFGDKLVLPLVRGTAQLYIHDSITAARRGYVNLEADMRSTVREFRTDSSFSAVLANRFTDITGHMAARPPHTIEAINYAGIEFEEIPAFELADNLNRIAGKIVLVGTTSDFADMHPTPIADNTPGIMIHAHGLSTMLHGRYVTRLSEWANWLIAIAMSLLFIAAQRWLADKDYGNLVMRLIQIGMLCAIVYAGCLLYLSAGISIDFSRPLVMVASALVACDVWTGIPALCRRARQLRLFNKLFNLLSR